MGRVAVPNWMNLAIWKVLGFSDSEQQDCLQPHVSSFNTFGPAEIMRNGRQVCWNYEDCQNHVAGMKTTWACFCCHTSLSNHRHSLFFLHFVKSLGFYLIFISSAFLIHDFDQAYLILIKS